MSNDIVEPDTDDYSYVVLDCDCGHAWHGFEKCPRCKCPAHHRKPATVTLSREEAERWRELVRDLAMSRHLMDPEMHPALFEECTEMLCKRARDEIPGL